MLEAGGLIKLHYHWNYDILQLFSEENGILYYRSESLFKNLEISQAEHNHLSKNNDGLFVDGTFEDRFSYDSEHDELYFDTRIVSREYTNQQITDMVNSLWTTDPFLEIGKVDMTYWLETLNDGASVKVYQNNSRDMNIQMKVLNPNSLILQTILDGVESFDIYSEHIYEIPPKKILTIYAPSGSTLSSVTISLV